MVSGWPRRKVRWKQATEALFAGGSCALVPSFRTNKQKTFFSKAPFLTDSKMGFQIASFQPFGANMRGCPGARSPRAGGSQAAAPWVLSLLSRGSCRFPCSSSSSFSHLLLKIRITIGLICCWIVLSHCSCSCNTDKIPVTSVLGEQ